jgi:hypothetical protein
MAEQMASNSVTMSRLSAALKSPRSVKIGKWLGGILVLVFGAFWLFCCATPPQIHFAEATLG